MTERGVPSAAELVEAVAEYLRGEVMEQTSGRLSFNARVAANVLGIVERELRLGAAAAEAHGMRLRELGAADDHELVAAIREGRLDDRLPELIAALRASTRERLEIANPRYVASGIDTRTPSDSCSGPEPSGPGG